MIPTGIALGPYETDWNQVKLPARRDKGITAAKAEPGYKDPGHAAPRERVMRAALDLFYREGIRAVGVEAVAGAAGTTKMSIYRHFASKDELVAACLADRVAAFWVWFDAVLARHPGAPRRQLVALFEGLGERATRPRYRGCPMSNAAIEFPDDGHPTHGIAVNHKRELRSRLLELAQANGAAEPERLADGLLLLFEGCYASSQLLGPDGPAGSVAAWLIDSTRLAAARRWRVRIPDASHGRRRATRRCRFLPDATGSGLAASALRPSSPPRHPAGCC